MHTDPTVLIEKYLADEMKLYQDWYAEVLPQAHDPDTIAFGMKESLADLKQRFAVWWQDSVEKNSLRLQQLKDRLCERWMKLQNAEKQVLIALVLDTLSSLHLPSSPSVATILVISGYLDHLCRCENELPTDE